jgi:isopenicillin N synthase-like dioxygenase
LYTISNTTTIIIPDYLSRLLIETSQYSVVQNGRNIDSLYSSRAAHATTQVRRLYFLSLLESPQGKAKFLMELREALVVEGFFYLTNIERFVPPGVQNAFVERSKDVLSLPLEKKLEMDMIKSKHFLGYSQTGKERTAQKLDNREMFDVGHCLPSLMAVVEESNTIRSS